MTTIDKTLPSTKILMILPKGTIYKESMLPDGYSYAAWDDSMKQKWVDLQISTGVFENEKDAQKEWEKISRGNPRESFVFVQDQDGALVGSGIILDGDEYGMKRAALKHVSVYEQDQYQGIGKAIVSRLALEYEKTPSKYPLYASLPMGAYGAVILLSRMGFTPYLGEFNGSTENQSRKNWETETEILRTKTKVN